MSITKQTKKMKDNAHIAWLVDEGAISYEENVIYAERAFIANSILQWCTKRADEKSLGEEEIRVYLKTLRFFIKKKIDLCWENGIITASAKKSAPTSGGSDDVCSSMETSNGK